MVFALAACAREAPKAEPQGKAFFAYFDTVSYVYSYAEDSVEQFNERAELVSGVLEKYHRLFDIYHEYTGMNNLCTVNRLAGGEPVEVDRELIDFLLYARELYTLTNGEMNIMLGAVLSMWHDCREAAENGEARLPDEQELLEAAGHTDISLLEIDEEKLTVRISDEHSSIDVGALGKGYATEKAAQALEEQGITSYVLNIGGNLRIIGTKPDGGRWVTGIRDPQNEGGSIDQRLLLADISCVTSGVYERYFTVDGKRYHHIIDKDTCYPAAYFSSVTVVSGDSALADALSTALFCMPIDEGMELLKGLAAEALWIFPSGEIEYSENFSQYME